MDIKQYAPIAVFTYARLDHTKKMIESLLCNEEAKMSDLFVFSDGPKNENISKDVKSVRDYLRTITGFKTIHLIERETNWGLANNLIDGISKIISEYKRIIVIEDDLILSKYFLRFMNEALEIYENEEKVSAVSGFVNPVKEKLPPTFFLKYFSCWGWATWERSWKSYIKDPLLLKEKLDAQNKIREFNIDHSFSFYGMLNYQIKGIINSWAIRFYGTSFVNDNLVLYPGRSLTKQNGIDGSGTHSGVSSSYNVSLADYPIVIEKNKIEVCKEAYQAYKKFYLRVGGMRAHLFRLLRFLRILN